MYASSLLPSDGSAAAALAAPPVTSMAVRLTGAVSLAAILLFGAAMVFPLWPWPQAEVVGGIAGVAFQLAVVLQLGVVRRTNAVGGHPAWRALVVVAAIAAFAGAVAMAVEHLTPSPTTLLLSNATWFLVMASMVGVGVGIVRAGAWRPPLRYLPLVAHSWPIVLMPATALLGGDGAWPLYSGYLFLVQALLAVTLILRPDLAGARGRRRASAT